LVELISGQVEMAMMRGLTTAPNHTIRADCQNQLFANYHGNKVVASPAGKDNVKTAEQAMAHMKMDSS
jgi:ribose transport system substrate-binding protein